jgi:hypothetical protein
MATTIGVLDLVTVPAGGDVDIAKPAVLLVGSTTAQP